MTYHKEEMNVLSRNPSPIREEKDDAWWETLDEYEEAEPTLASRKHSKENQASLQTRGMTEICFLCLLEARPTASWGAKRLVSIKEDQSVFAGGLVGEDKNPFGQIGGIGTIVLRVASPGDVVLIFSEYLSRRLEISLGLSMFLYLRPLVMAPSGGFSIIYVRVIYDASTAINDFRLETCSETKGKGILRIR
ncbi:hypothetical protein RCL_jg10363.t2 [Rhizophagus clarus]|uniref:Uncharacterized protein n=1 Tax=Rhizophagus clarus TaxID=94130 RepID=A0A8H3KTV9_9GLOM|nr:hypothetical protein RCL_jg10363.t2 [Rhizophagus clarus]